MLSRHTLFVPFGNALPVVDPPYAHAPPVVASSRLRSTRLFWIVAKSPYPVTSAEHPASGGTFGASQITVLCVSDCPAVALPEPIRIPDSCACPPASVAWP